MKLIVLALLLALLSQPVGSVVAQENSGTIQPLVTTAELVSGANRFAFGLAKDNVLLENKKVSVRLYAIAGNQAQFEREIAAPYQPVEHRATGERVHRHADGSRHVHTADNSVRGLYIARVEFSRPGPWGVEILMREDARSESARLMVAVRERAASPTIGAPAPRSRNLIARDVKELRQLTTSAEPEPRLYQTRIADAIAQGKPQVIVFATPQFCTSRMCGPVLDVVTSLLPSYGKQFAFVHQEIWQDFAAKKAFPTVDEWRLDTEPWVFVVDGAGIIRAKFEGLLTGQELEHALRGVLARR